jgi:uncharacterized protein (DUF2267 family)
LKCNEWPATAALNGHALDLLNEGASVPSLPHMGRRTETSSPGAHLPQVDRPDTDILTERFFHAIEISGHLPDGLTAPEAVAGVLGTLLHRLPAQKARDLAAALPESLSALLRPFAQDRPADPARFDRDGFVRLVSALFDIDEGSALRLARVVFAAFEYELPMERVVSDLERELPRKLGRLWRHDQAGLDEGAD